MIKTVSKMLSFIFFFSWSWFVLNIFWMLWPVLRFVIFFFLFFFLSAIWQSSESWPSVAPSNASTSIWEWRLGKVSIWLHPRQTCVYIKNRKGIFICVLTISFVLLVNILSDMLAQSAFVITFPFFFWIMYSIWYNIYTQTSCDFPFVCC